MDKYSERKVNELTVSEKQKYLRWYKEGKPIQYWDEDTMGWVLFKSEPMFVRGSKIRRKRETYNEKRERKERPIVMAQIDQFKAKIEDSANYSVLIQNNPNWAFKVYIEAIWQGDIQD